MKLLVVTQKIDVEDDVLGFFTYWVKALSDRAERVEVICLAKGESDLPDNVGVYSVGKEKNWPRPFRALVFYWYLLKLLPSVDGVFVHMAPEYVKAIYPLNLLFRKPIVMWYAHIKVSPTAKWALERVNYVLSPSKESFELDSQKVIATGHGINTEHFRPLKKPLEAEVLHLGRISKVKKVETLIEAASLVVKTLPHIKINIYGAPARPEDAQYLTSLKEMIRERGLEKNIFWKGAISNKETPGIYASHKIFVRMQGGGGYGKVELEAMSCGIPAIVPTQVYKRDLGEFADELYFPESDSQALAGRILSVLSWDERKREEYSKISRSMVVNKHNVENVASKVVELLKNKVRG
jgi:glycosyltransferase involved in cell wall biosynthesis